MTDSYEALQALCRLNFGAFAQKVFGIIEPETKYEYSWHLGCISEHLEAMYRGELTRLIINLPPRTLKSFTVARAFPAWVMGKRPQEKFISTSYGYEVTEQNAIACRRIMKSEWYMDTFPETVITPDLDRNTHFETTKGGQYYAASALSPLTGLGCSYLVADDLLKPMEAYSPTVRSSTNANMRTTFFSRFNDQRTGKFLMVMQRLHEDDPTGHLMKDGGYTLLKLPAETKTQIHIRLGEKKWDMPENSLLFPARLSRKVLDQMRLDMSEANYSAQMLQDPVPAGGGEFREEWMQWQSKGGVKPKEMNLVILVDAAGGDDLNKKKKKLSDWTVMAVVGLAADNNYYLLDMVRDRLNPTERIDTLFLLHRKWNELAGKPPKVGYEKYGMMTDTHYIREKQKQDSYNFPIIELGGRMMKEDRIRRLVPDMQNGRWYFPAELTYVDTEGRKFDLITELKGEMASFPRARYDDCCDALSRLYESELFLTHPKLKITMAKKAMNARLSAAPESWEDF